VIEISTNVSSHLFHTTEGKELSLINGKKIYKSITLVNMQQATNHVW